MFYICRYCVFTLCCRSVRLYCFTVAVERKYRFLHNIIVLVRLGFNPQMISGIQFTHLNEFQVAELQMVTVISKKLTVIYHQNIMQEFSRSRDRWQAVSVFFVCRELQKNIKIENYSRGWLSNATPVQISLYVMQILSVSIKVCSLKETYFIKKHF